jgi:tRNA-splicing ligase RtcB
MEKKTFEVFQGAAGGVVKAWTVGVLFEDAARKQVERVASMPFIHKWVAVMPDVHAGVGATVGSVIATVNAIIPAAVGVDIGCGMMAVETTLTATNLPDNLHDIRTAIEAAVPHGRTENGRPGDRGAWHDVPATHASAWRSLEDRYNVIIEKHPKIARGPAAQHLGTLGTGNHFIEICLDESQHVWFMLHSGSRGVGNRVGRYFIEAAKEEMRRWMINLPDMDLAYLPENTTKFNDYVQAVSWAQDFAALNRQMMMHSVFEAVRKTGLVPAFEATAQAVNCHHNYIAREHHYGQDVIVTRKGAVRARAGDLGIIPGSMGARSFIVRGKGNPESFDSCSHGAGRAMSRTEAKRRFTLADHEAATKDVECRKDADVIDETPAAYKPIDAVMHAQRDLVDIVHELKQIVCVKG